VFLLQLSDARSQREELVSELASLTNQVSALQSEIDSRDEKMTTLEAAAEQANKGGHACLCSLVSRFLASLAVSSGLHFSSAWCEGAQSYGVRALIAGQLNSVNTAVPLQAAVHHKRWVHMLVI
jgi:urease accessory protein UreF